MSDLNQAKPSTIASDDTAQVAGNVLSTEEAQKVINRILASKDKISDLSEYTPNQIQDIVMILKSEASRLREQEKITAIEKAWAVEETTISRKSNQEIDTIPAVKEVRAKYDIELQKKISEYQKQITDVVKIYDNSKKVIEKEAADLKEKWITIPMKVWLEKAVGEIVKWSNIIIHLNKPDTSNSALPSHPQSHSDSDQHSIDPTKTIKEGADDVSVVGENAQDDAL